MAEALIIGAGPAGLTAAYELNKLGIRSTVIEADQQIGGLSRTVNHAGYRFDIGGHRFFSKVPLINQLWREILGEDFLLRPRLSRIHYANHFFDYPLKAANALAGLGPIEATLVTLSYAKAKLFPHSEETNFEQWVANRFGQRLFEIFFKTYTEKVWGVPCKDISAEWAVQRIKNLSLHEALRNALFGSQSSKGGEIVTSLIDAFHYPRFGPGMMWERCQDVLTQRGMKTITGVKVETIRHQNGRVLAVSGRTASGDLIECESEQIISTMPLRNLIRALDPPPPDEVRQAAEGLRYRDYLTVALIVRRASVFPDNWLYIHSPEVKVGRIQNYKNWSPEMVPDASRTSLGLEYFLWDREEMWSWSTQRLIDLGIRECAEIGLIEAGEVEDGTVVRMKKAYPIYDHHYRNHLAIIRNYLKTIGNLQTIGRNGLHRYNNQDHSMLTGIYAARNIAGGQYDVWSVNTEKEYHEEAGQTAGGDRLVPLGVIPSPANHDVSTEAIIEAVFARLDPVALGTALGIVSGALLFLITIATRLRSESADIALLSLLSNYLVGYEVSWAGALIGLLEAVAIGYSIGFTIAGLRNFGMSAYAYLLKRRSAQQSPRDFLDQV